MIRCYMSLMTSYNILIIKLTSFAKIINKSLKYQLTKTNQTDRIVEVVA